MFKKIFKKKETENNDNSKILIASILVHAAKIDEIYTDIEKKIIKKALLNLYGIEEVEAAKILSLAEIKEQELGKMKNNNFLCVLKTYLCGFRIK